MSVNLRSKQHKSTVKAALECIRLLGADRIAQTMESGYNADPESHLFGLLQDERIPMLKLATDLLQPGMVLAKSIIDEHGSVLLRAGVSLTPEYIANLRRRGFPSAYVCDGDTDDIVIEDIISDEVRQKAHSTLVQVVDFTKKVANEFIRLGKDGTLTGTEDAGLGDALRSSQEFEQLEQAVTSIIEELMNVETLTGVAQIRSHDDTTFSHSIEVTVTALMIGKRLYLSRRDLEWLGTGCMLHDIGKVFIKPAVLKKQSPLTPEEAARLREHPKLGYELLRARNPDSVMVNHVALQHHERQDGRGYPRGLQGTNSIRRSPADQRNILLIAEIAAVADTYDLLSVERPGRPALRPQQIAATMHRLAGPILNRQIVQHFLSLLPIFPVGIDIVVTTGRYKGYKGIVAQSNRRDPERPVIRLLFNPQGDRVVPIELNLAQDHNTAVEAILHQ